MDGKHFYDMANSQLNMKDRKSYLSTLTEEQRKLYTRYGNKHDKTNLKQMKRIKKNII